MEYTPDKLKCPWCGETGAVEYDDFGTSNGSEGVTYCSNCEKPLIAVIDMLFSIKKVEE